MFKSFCQLSIYANGFVSFVKSSGLDVWLGSDHASAHTDE